MGKRCVLSHMLGSRQCVSSQPIAESTSNKRLGFSMFDLYILYLLASHGPVHPIDRSGAIPIE